VFPGSTLTAVLLLIPEKACPEKNNISNTSKTARRFVNTVFIRPVPLVKIQQQTHIISIKSAMILLPKLSEAGA
jgi:hypothetical protein